jgi:DNA (cytosine-5)-methyltransferase 1
MKFGMQTLELNQRGPERFSAEGKTVSRKITRRDGSICCTELVAELDRSENSMPPDARHDLAWLTSTKAPQLANPSGAVRVVDLFAGCGGLSLGVAEACRALHLEMWPVLANDIDSQALDVYGLNFPEAELSSKPVEDLLDSELGSSLSSAERALRSRLGKIDLVIGGPPCQGHSDLNNHTRNDDPKNELYLKMARFCEVVEPSNVIIENVPGVERDRSRVAQRTWQRLDDLGYRLDTGIIDASRLGVAQRRKRSVTIASREISPSVITATGDVETRERDLTWAIGDLQELESKLIFDSPPSPTATNVDRIDYLFDEDLYELPDSQRPDCHRLKKHSYVSIYGRLHWDRPAQTLTTGFGTMGRGRHVHPSERRTITPHEAARIQFFPDFFDFGAAGRTLLQKIIGNAVPPKMGYALGLHLLR